jgi:flagellar hook-length control protein FliK
MLNAPSIKAPSNCVVSIAPQNTVDEPKHPFSDVLAQSDQQNDDTLETVEASDGGFDETDHEGANETASILPLAPLSLQSVKSDAVQVNALSVLPAWLPQLQQAQNAQPGALAIISDAKEMSASVLDKSFGMLASDQSIITNDQSVLPQVLVSNLTPSPLKDVQAQLHKTVASPDETNNAELAIANFGLSVESDLVVAAKANQVSDPFTSTVGLSSASADLGLGTVETGINVLATTKSFTGNVAPHVNVASQASIDLPMTHAQWGEVFSSRVALMGKEQLSEASIQVIPPELGPVDIKLQFEGNRINAQFGVSSIEARDAVNANLHRLREMLAGEGLNLGQTFVGHQQQNADRAREYVQRHYRQDETPGSDVEIVPTNRLSAMRIGLLDEFA